MRTGLTLQKSVIILILLLGAGGIFFWDWLILTDAERVEARIEQIAEGIRTNDPDKVLACLDESFQMEAMGPAELHEWHKSVLENMKITRFTVERPQEITRDEKDSGLMRTGAASTVELSAFPGQPILVKWELVFRLNGEDDWRLRSVRVFDYNSGTELYPPKMSGR